MGKLPRACMRDQIRSKLVERIVSGEYPPGTHLKELVLAREFNVSQAPVREALRELEAAGLVESQRFRGTRVLGLNPEELRQAYELREIIEVAAVERVLPLANEDFAGLEAIVDEMARAIARSDVKDLCTQGMRFHRRLVELSGNVMFLRAWDGLTWDVRVRVVALVVGHDFTQGLADKRAVLDALCQGDSAAAAERLSGIIRGMIARIGETEFPSHVAAVAATGPAIPEAAA
jgi:DNA-binding GntR family transcriptional regulator